MSSYNILICMSDGSRHRGAIRAAKEIAMFGYYSALTFYMAVKSGFNALLCFILIVIGNIS